MSKRMSGVLSPVVAPFQSAGLDPARMMPGGGCCSLTDSVRLTAHAVKLGCAGVPINSSVLRLRIQL